jgi:uncharacterized protein YjbJ (UPF0337 family)
MGVGEKFKGAVKEKIGEYTDRDELRAEGHAQQRKGEHEVRETKERAEAQAHQQKADAYERRQDALEEE